MLDSFNNNDEISGLEGDQEPNKPVSGRRNF